MDCEFLIINIKIALQFKHSTTQKTITHSMQFKIIMLFNTLVTFELWSQYVPEIQKKTYKLKTFKFQHSYFLLFSVTL